MSRADDLRARYEAEIRVAELEDELTAAKKKKAGPSQELKLALREARQAFREVREGDAVANPAAVNANAKVEDTQ